MFMPRILSILIVVNLREDDLLVQTESVVATAVECVAVDAAEVAYTRQSYVEQTIQELPHTVTTQGYLNAYRHALTQLEVCDGLLSVGDDRLLAGDQGDIADDSLDNLGVTVCFLPQPTLMTILSSFGICITLSY